MWSDEGRQHGAKSYPYSYQGSRSKPSLDDAFWGGGGERTGHSWTGGTKGGDGIAYGPLWARARG